jgi:YtcA family
MHQHIPRANEPKEPARACPLPRAGGAPPEEFARPRRASSRSVCLVLALGAALPGCAAAPPSIVVLGASFPDWLFCITGGVVATAIVHLAMARARRLAWLAPPAVTYPALTATLAALAWVLFFRR